MSSRDDIVGRYLGQPVPVHFNPGFVVLSYVVSLLGAGSTLELINRRTSWKGTYNHLLLVGAAISMGGIAIWSMHFVGNQAIILLNNESELQIAYSMSVTAASFFVPIIVLLLAFLAVSSNNEVKWWRILLSGSLSGGAICGMHYLGDASISNYHCSYATVNIVCAAIIAVTASSVALALFFVFKATWNNAWWKRVGCMNVLAGAVSGMHWCAALGTQYTLVEAPASTGPGSQASRNTTVIAVICLSVAASFIMVAVAIYSAKTMKNYATKAQQIVLAAAVFDSQGRILVNTDGRLPSEKITDSFPQKAQDDVFSTSHPLFHWMYRASHSWSPIKALLGSMTTHLNYLRECEPGNRINHNRDIKLVRDSGALIDNYELVFRELFCLAASTLATRMAEDLTDVGVLWDEIFSTGQRKQPARPSTRLSSRLDVMVGASGKGAAQSDAASGRNVEDVEKGYALRQQDHHNVGQGSLMFLVRHLSDPHDVTRLEAAGFLFAEPSRVSDIIRTSMQIKTRCLDEKFREMAVKASSTPLSPGSSSSSSPGSALMDPGVHVGIFAIRARVDKVGFDVLVKRSARSALPTMRLALGSRGLEQGHLDLLRELDGLPVQTLLRKLACMTEPVFNAQQVYFATQLRTAAAALRAQVDDPALDTATLSARVIEVPCRPAAMDGTVLSPTNSSRPSLASNAPIMTTCSLISLQLVLDIHDHFDGNKMTEFIPLPFFKAQQMVYDNSPHQAAFSQSLHREISEIMTMVPAESWSNPIVAAFQGGNGSHARGHAVKSSTVSIRSGSTANLCAGDQSGLESGRTSPPPFDDVHSAPLPPKPSAFGGIMVSQEVAVSVSDANALGSRVSERLAMGNTRPGAQRKLTSTVITKNRKGSGESTVEIVEKGTMSPMSPLSRQPSSVGRPSPLSPVVLYASNVEASANSEEQATFVDELFKNCIRRRS